MVISKHKLEGQLKDEHQLIKDGVIHDDNPLDSSSEFERLCNACRLGDLKTCQEMISLGANINAKDAFDYTPLILASLCGHYEVVQLLLESGALCERDTFQGERCLYNALNNKIRSLLLQYDYSKSTDPLQPWALHISSLLTRTVPETSDIRIVAGSHTFNLHKFILSARSPYFRKKLSVAPETRFWKMESSIPPESFHIAIQYLYMGDINSDSGIAANGLLTENEVFKGIDKICKKLEIRSLWESVLSVSDRRVTRQRHQDEMTHGCNQVDTWFRDNILRQRISVETSKVAEVKWKRENHLFADVLLRVDEAEETMSPATEIPPVRTTDGPLNGIPIGPSSQTGKADTESPEKPPRSMIYPVHRAMLIRSEYFLTMFTSKFQEAQVSETLHIVKVDCSPDVLEIILTFLYTEKADFGLDVAVDVLFISDMLFIEKLKTKAALIISTLGNGTIATTRSSDHQEDEIEPVNIYDVIHAGWQLKVQRLEEFAARYLAYRLEDYIDEEDFEELIRESASRIRKRQETDSIELLDDIRYYLSERFRLRFTESGLDEMLAQNDDTHASAPSAPAPSQSVESPRIPSSSSVPDCTASPAGVAPSDPSRAANGGAIRTLEGDIAGEEFATDALAYQILLEKIDGLLEKLKLDA